jgi:hypothetical protein
MPKADKKERAVLVTTEHRGVFVGQTTDADTADPITLTKARMVIYWDASCHGVLGIAARGISKSSRLSPAVDRIVLRNVTAVVEATPEAEKSWAAEPWAG